jgi:hypothetical protein
MGQSELQAGSNPRGKVRIGTLQILLDVAGTFVDIGCGSSGARFLVVRQEGKDAFPETDYIWPVVRRLGDRKLVKKV